MKKFSDAKMSRVVKGILSIQPRLYIYQVRNLFQIMFPNVDVENLDEAVKKFRKEKRMGVPPIVVDFYGG